MGERVTYTEDLRSVSSCSSNPSPFNPILIHLNPNPFNPVLVHPMLIQYTASTLCNTYGVWGRGWGRELLTLRTCGLYILFHLIQIHLNPYPFNPTLIHLNPYPFNPILFHPILIQYTASSLCNTGCGVGGGGELLTPRTNSLCLLPNLQLLVNILPPCLSVTLGRGRGVGERVTYTEDLRSVYSCSSNPNPFKSLSI